MLREIIDQCPNVAITISAKELREFAVFLINETKTVVLAEAEKHQQSDELVDIETAKKMLSVSAMTLYRWDKTGYLRKVCIGGQKRYRKSDIVKIMEG